MRRSHLVLGLLLVVPALAHAQAAVTVEVRAPDGSPADGQVSLTPEGASAPSHRCQTRAGACTMTGVAGGRYLVRLQPGGGSEPPEPRMVMIPPAGSATLRVSTH